MSVKALLLFAISFMAIGCARESASHSKLQWFSGSFEEALKAAQKAKKPIMVDVYTDWCTWCKKLDSDVYTSDEINSLADKFIFVKVDAEKKDGPGIARYYRIEGFPTVLLVDGLGRELHRITGYLPAKEFAAEMQQVL